MAMFIESFGMPACRQSAACAAASIWVRERTEATGQPPMALGGRSL